MQIFGDNAGPELLPPIFSSDILFRAVLEATDSENL